MGVEDRRRPDLELASGFKSIKNFGYKNGRFPDVLKVNEEAIKWLFRIAGLGYNGIVIEPMPKANMHENKGHQKRPLFTTAKVNGRWTIQIDDEEIMEKLERRAPKESHQENFAQELNGLMKAAVLKCIRKEQFSNGDDMPLFEQPPEAFDTDRCWFFLHPLSGVTLVRASK